MNYSKVFLCVLLTLATMGCNEGGVSGYATGPGTFEGYVDGSPQGSGGTGPALTKGLNFVSIKPGTFLMGSPTYVPGLNFDAADETQHSVTLAHGFEMQATDVTQSQWVAVMGSNPSYFAGSKYCPKTFV